MLAGPRAKRTFPRLSPTRTSRGDAFCDHPPPPYAFRRLTSAERGVARSILVRLLRTYLTSTICRATNRRSLGLMYISQPTQSEGTCKSTSIFSSHDTVCIPLLVLYHLQRNHLRPLWGLGTFLPVFPTAKRLTSSCSSYARAYSYQHPNHPNCLIFSTPGCSRILLPYSPSCRRTNSGCGRLSYSHMRVCVCYASDF